MTVDAARLLLYGALALASFALFVRMWARGSLLETPAWGLYVAHLPVACLVWALQMWQTRFWISAASNMWLLACAVEALNLFMFNAPRRERNWAAGFCASAGLVAGGVAATAYTLPRYTPAWYYLIGCTAPIVVCVAIAAIWLYWRIEQGQHIEQTRYGWHALILFSWCAANALNYAASNPDLWWLRVYVTTTFKTALIGLWWLKVSAVNRPSVSTRGTTDASPDAHGVGVARRPWL